MVLVLVDEGEHGFVVFEEGVLDFGVLVVFFFVFFVERRDVVSVEMRRSCGGGDVVFGFFEGLEVGFSDL